jgi:N-acetyl-anhydromuramyl-L-alanine amidase AmpD
MAIDIINSLPVHETRKPRTRDITPLAGDLDTIVVHTTNSTYPISSLAKYNVRPSLLNHISVLGCPTFTYHDVIKENTNIYRCVPYEWETWHAGNFNFQSIAVALNYVSENKSGNLHFAPSQGMLKSLYRHLGHLCLKRGISPARIKGHRELPKTGWFWYKGSKVLRKRCPGLEVDLDLMRTQATKYLQLNLKANGLYKEGRVDGLYGSMTWAALHDYHLK